MACNDTTDTLVCTSIGGMVSVGTGFCSTQTPVSFSQHIVDRVRAKYETVMILEPEDQGKYMCSVRNELKSSHAVLLTEYDAGKFVVNTGIFSVACMSYNDLGQDCSIQVVGRQGEQFTLLCLADEPVQNAAWTAYTSNSITFTELHKSNAGIYTCRGTIGDQEVMSSVTLNISGMSAIYCIENIKLPKCIN